MGEASFFLNYGYVSAGNGDEAPRRRCPTTFPIGTRSASRSSSWARPTWPGATCSTSVVVAAAPRRLLAEQFGARRRRASTSRRRRSRSVARAPSVGRALRGRRRRAPAVRRRSRSTSSPTSSRRTPIPTCARSSNEVTRVLRPGGWFLHTDLLAGQRWMEVKAILAALRLHHRRRPRDHRERARVVRRGRGEPHRRVRRPRRRRSTTSSRFRGRRSTSRWHPVRGSTGSSARACGHDATTATATSRRLAVPGRPRRGRANRSFVAVLGPDDAESRRAARARRSTAIVPSARAWRRRTEVGATARGCLPPIVPLASVGASVDRRPRRRP